MKNIIGIFAFVVASVLGKVLYKESPAAAMILVLICGIGYLAYTIYKKQNKKEKI
jgi:threonine/homoserine/homoserine lactone efflux protein